MPFRSGSSGYRKFLDGVSHLSRPVPRTCAGGPKTENPLLIGCCDSRVSPEVIFDARPVEISSVRKTSQILLRLRAKRRSACTSAALEFAVMGLRVEHIVVMGHAGCGGVRAFAENEGDPYTRPAFTRDFIGKWVKLLAPAYERAGPVPQDSRNAVSESFSKSWRWIGQAVAGKPAHLPCVKTLEERGDFRCMARISVSWTVCCACGPETGRFDRVS